MKKGIQTIGIAMAVVLANVYGAAAADKAGDVVLVRGKAQIERSTGTVPAQIKAALLESDSVATRSRSRVKMLFRDDSILTIGSNSRLVIKKYLYNPKNKKAESLYELADGKLRSVAGGPGFKVVTPTAFAAARGTLFTVSYDPETGTTTINVTEGAVEVRNVDTGVEGVQVVKAGESTSVKANEPPTTPVPSAGEPFDDNGNDMPEVETETGDGLEHELENELGKAGFEPPIEQEPAHTTTKTFLDLRFR
jgi:hypothetical protein